MTLEEQSASAKIITVMSTETRNATEVGINIGTVFSA